MSGRVPPFQLVGMTFGIGGVFVLAIGAAQERLGDAGRANICASSMPTSPWSG